MSIFCVTLVYTIIGMNTALWLFLNHYCSLITLVSFLLSDPPDTPIITGYNEGAEVKARSLLRLQCYANGGNPLATLQWYKNGQPLESVKGTSTTVASAELTIILEKTDNGALYQCNATNTATPQPLQANKTLNVLCKTFW